MDILDNMYIEIEYDNKRIARGSLREVSKKMNIWQKEDNRCCLAYKNKLPIFYYPEPKNNVLFEIPYKDRSDNNSDRSIYNNLFTLSKNKKAALFIDYDIWINIHNFKERILINIKLWFDIDDDDYIVSTNSMGISWNPYRSDNFLNIVTAYSIEIDIDGHVRLKDRFGNDCRNARVYLNGLKRTD